MSALPQGWADTSLGMVAEFEMGQAPPGTACNTVGLGTVFVKAGEFGREKPVVREWTTEPKKFAKDGDVLICVVGATAGKLNLGIDCAIGRSVAAIRPSHDILQKTVYFQLLPQVETLRAGTTGSAQGVISKEALSAIPIAIPPLPEQKRIADKLDTVLARVDACRDRLDRIPALLKRFRQSILAAATSGRLTEDWRTTHGPDEAQRNPGTTEPDSNAAAPSSEQTVARSPIVIFPSDQDRLVNSWKWRQLTSLAQLESGHTPRKSVPEYWENGTVPWISLQDIRAADGTVLHDTKYKPTELGIANSSARLLPAGTVCFCRDISFGYVTIMGKEMSTTQHFANWVCGHQLVPKYLMYAFMAGRDFLGMSGQGTTVTTIYMPALKELRLATPPLEEQHEIVRRVETLFAFADRLEARLATARKQAGQLTPALLAKAFRGELVPQDPKDEPATELLKRLATQRNAAPKATRGRKPSAK